MGSAFQSVILGFLFLIAGAFASWLISRAYYERSTRAFFGIIGGEPWQLFANIEERIRARLKILVDGEPALELTRLRYQFSNYGHVPIVPHSPITLPLKVGATIVEASVPEAGPAGLQLGLSIESKNHIPELLITAPILNPGDRFVLEVLVRNLETRFKPIFNLQAPGLPHQIVPTPSAPYSERSRLFRLFTWLWALFPSLFLIYMLVVAVRYLAVFFGWTDLPSLFQMPANAIPPPRAYWVTGALLILGGLAQLFGLLTTRTERRSVPAFATMVDREDLRVTSLPLETPLSSKTDGEQIVGREPR